MRRGPQPHRDVHDLRRVGELLHATGKARCALHHREERVGLVHRDAMRIRVGRDEAVYRRHQLVLEARLRIWQRVFLIEIRRLERQRRPGRLTRKSGWLYC